MSLSAEQLQFLADKGLSFADAIEFARLSEKKKDPTNAERQARHRASKRNAVTVTRDPPIDNNHTPSNNPIEANASIAPRGRKPKTSHRLPDDWQPEPLTAETAKMVSAWQPGMIERELSKFKNYWAAASGRNAVKNDWQAAWRYWLGNADGRGIGNGNTGRISNNSGGNGRTNGFAKALQQVADGPFDEPFRFDGGRM